MSMGRKTPVAILISGRGSNMSSLITAAANPDYPAKVVGVISNRADAAGLQNAAREGIPTRLIAHGDYPTRHEHDEAIGRALAQMGAELVCLAGYMRMLTPAFVEAWTARMINIHPSLLPLFKGTDTHAQALAAGMRIHGCTVHYVTPEVDSGPIIAQAAVPVVPEDTPQTLAARVLSAEHRLYPEALALVAAGRARLKGNKVELPPAGPVQDPAVLFSPSGDRPGDAGPADLEALARFTP